MSILNVRHLTRYRYRQLVAIGEHRMMFRPRESYDQRVLESRLIISPRPTELRTIQDVFGNCIEIARFSGRTSELVFESHNRLQLLPDDALNEIAGPDRGMNHYPFRYSPQDYPDLVSSMEWRHPDPDGILERWAKGFLQPGDASDAPKFLAAMTLAIHDEMEYCGRASGPPQTPLETLALGRGTCRDFAVLMMEAARALGLAARFVSGYLHVGAGGLERRGGGNTHAWVRVYLPSGGWAEFDPTNGLVGNRDLIRVAVARDPAQAVPLSGTWIGEAEDYLGMDVEVSVSAEDTPGAGRKYA